MPLKGNAVPPASPKFQKIGELPDASLNLKAIPYNPHTQYSEHLQNMATASTPSITWNTASGGVYTQNPSQKADAQDKMVVAAKEAKAITDIQHINNQTQDKTFSSEEVVAHPAVFNTQKTGCSIYVQGGRTINTGNYNSVSIKVGLTVPVDPQHLDTAFEWASDWISKRIEAEVKDATGEE